MATEEHLDLSNKIKICHATLRKRTREYGVKRAWSEHLGSKENLADYAKAMKYLALNHWEVNDNKPLAIGKTRSRITWSVNYCITYYLKDEIICHLRERERRIEEELVAKTPLEYIPLIGLQRNEFYKNNKIQLLDVGSCYNPFNKHPEFNVTAIDIAPAVPDVYECDFLNVDVSEQCEYSRENCRIIVKLPSASFDVIVFSLLLEYLPTSEQRILCCEKAMELLKIEGILIIITPDSKHVGANARLMKTWRYTLALMGFLRIKYEKLEHITCMVFRKCPNPDVAKRWARIYKEDYMDFKIEIPQDKIVINVADEEESRNSSDSLAISEASGIKGEQP